MTKQEIRDVIGHIRTKIDEAVAALRTNLKHDEEGFIAEDSALSVALRVMEDTSSYLALLSFRIAREDEG
jgi:hypothetical protein